MGKRQKQGSRGGALKPRPSAGATEIQRSRPRNDGATRVIQIPLGSAPAPSPTGTPALHPIALSLLASGSLRGVPSGSVVSKEARSLLRVECLAQLDARAFGDVGALKRPRQEVLFLGRLLGGLGVDRGAPQEEQRFHSGWMTSSSTARLPRMKSAAGSVLLARISRPWQPRKDVSRLLFVEALLDRPRVLHIHLAPGAQHQVCYPSCRHRRTIAEPTSPRWPATNTFSVVFIRWRLPFTRSVQAALRWCCCTRRRAGEGEYMGPVAPWWTTTPADPELRHHSNRCSSSPRTAELWHPRR